MDWGVLASLAAVIVTAVLGALAIAREQSAMRQLERVTAVLKDTSQDFEGRQELLWLQSTLSTRVNLQYRAPRKRRVLIYGWATRLAGAGLLLWVYFVVTSAFVSSALIDSGGQPRVGATWAMLGVIVALGVAGTAVGARHLRRRDRERRAWVEAASSDASEAPQL
ncbi:hypothetical protein [Curtobacterium flaccumfaciens]|uniref:hypothetical protein n=1 Tax=Curtobacterium flaccumfaciens TaxID=2035 RepID=UPI00217D1756|nr:hypothetical protein [Curtobacterium flaccumfaciens]MCS6587146.1 hypothetical protein [Curtobacterium flaccumfaciens pv. flaccumfaciens]